MKVFYLNDGSNNVTVQVNKVGGDPWEWDSTLLMPTEGKEFEVIVNDDQVLFIKKWDNVVLLSHKDKS